MSFVDLLVFIREACKEDQLDLEEKCKRKKKDKRFFRRSGVGVGVTQGRGCAW